MKAIQYIALGFLLAVGTAIGFAQVRKAATYAISGNAHANATVTLHQQTPQITSAVCDSGGNYQFAGLSNGVYQIKASHPDCSFKPGARTVTVSNGNVTGIDFSGACAGPYTPRKK
jgi:hypothetical protein